MKDENEELEFNRKNREEYETLMKEASTDLDQYWDSNNIVVKIFFTLLAIGIIVGVVYYFMIYFQGR
ncbi:MAG: hypothetical protein IJI60_01295 [Bacilli bacterium]|nr:hypothetical protein [Bacilli bacterium]